ncbi:MAG TPA: glycosyltransferase family A protein [Candidatus Saccharimonadales bacterium]|nr:glycosyltransferase family A protein [Candidatus Saccharimonadales bacterium]
MIVALLALGIVSCAELLLWWTPLWRWRRVAAPCLLAGIAITTVALLAAQSALWTALVAVFSAYRCVNLGRVAANRIQADFLFHTSWQSYWWLVSFQLLTVTIAAASRHYELTSSQWQMAGAAGTLGCAIGLLGSALRHGRTTKPRPVRRLTSAELPTLTVAIPARNETTDLEECLESVLTSTYPKLEVIVLDDCSQNKRTPEIIRGFAHSGVRFIAGDEPPQSWLAKNYAYAQLAKAANGEVLLFCGVDTRFAPDSFTVLVETLLQRHKTMLSVLPRNAAPPRGSGLAAWFMQPNRYAWELALPRRLLRRPPVLSTCWLITRPALQAAGGFAAVRRKGVPESYLARVTATANDGYSFLQAGTTIGLTSRKVPAEQRATAVRTRYLQLHRRPELVVGVGLAELGVLLGPFGLLIAALLESTAALAILAALSVVLNVILYARLVNLTYRRFVLKGVWLLPLAVLYDFGLLNYSMWRYEFREVVWKGRNVCIPVMRVITPGSE